MAKTLLNQEGGEALNKDPLPIVVILAEWPQSIDDGVSLACGKVGRAFIRGIPAKFPHGQTVRVMALEGNRAKKEQVVQVLSEMIDQRGAVIFYGHGCKSGQALMEAILNEAEAIRPAINLTNCGLLRRKIVYAVACHSARELGPRAVEKFATSYIGYSGRLALMVNQRLIPGIEDCLNAGLTELLQNRKSCGDAVLAMYRAYGELRRSFILKKGEKDMVACAMAVGNSQEALVSKPLGHSGATLW